MVVDFFVVVGSYVIEVVCVLVGVAFVTLMEQKILGGIQIRLGPNKVGYWGLLQPFSDAVKLFMKENMMIRSGNVIIYYVAPVISLGLASFLWMLMPFVSGGLSFEMGVLFFICVSGLGVYPILSMGWSSNCKYSVLGSLRAVAQMVSYEVSLGMVLLSVVVLSGSFELLKIYSSQGCIGWVMVCVPLSLVWLASMLAETNRTPYDFAEGESELVSGFNVEYSGGGFVLIFMSEYASMIFMSLFYVVIFFGGYMFSVVGILKSFIIVYLMVWVRGTLPRFRYDKLMGLAWKSFLPISLMVFAYYIFLMDFMNL
uniref:NADH-ubiquinone oxidoreductase chain 1 n=1 Tax=Bahadzia jaraguensis TaxID=1041811 RepID=K7ZU70_BAHJA|nr:NADH dehydrogenase subunit 1 [Bahadzia jaraguensis]